LTVVLATVVFVFAANVLSCGDKSGATGGFASIDGVTDGNCFRAGAGVDEVSEDGGVGAVEVGAATVA
jgi:hypothetical protein